MPFEFRRLLSGLIILVYFVKRKSVQLLLARFTAGTVGNLFARSVSSRAEQAHILFVFEQFVLQLNIHRFALDVLHLIINRRGAELKFGFGSGDAAIFRSFFFRF